MINLLKERPISVLLLFSLVVFLLLLTPYVPEITSGDFEEWCKQNLGENYKTILIASFVIGTIILAYVTVDLSKFIGKNNRKGYDKLNIPWSLEREESLKKAKKALSKAKAKKAIEHLYELEIPELDEKINILAIRLAEFSSEKLYGTLSSETQLTHQNKINKEVLALIQAIEKSLQEENEINHKIKDYLLRRYENRLKQKLGSRQSINLSTTPTSEGTSEETSDSFVTITEENIQTEIKDIFEKAHGRLLITGIPGSGKTVLMLQLVLSLLKEKKGAIPILLNLATWKSNYLKLDAWLEAILPSELGVNKALAKKILKDVPLMLLLDGLDEVKEEERKSCLEAIGKYGANPQSQFVISTRKKEYVAIQKDAPVNLQVEVKPLQAEQVTIQLRQIGYDTPEAIPLATAIEKDNNLRDIVTTPIYFNILQLLFSQGIRWSEISSSFDKGVLKSKIIDFFIYNQVQSFDKKWPKDDSKQWLSFLAHSMQQRNLVVFELIYLQYDWWKWSRKNHFFKGLVYGLVYGLFIGPVGGLFMGLVFGLFIGLVGGLLLGLAIGLFAVLFVVLVIGLKNEDYDSIIYTKENLKFSINTFLNNLFSKKSLVYGLVVGLFTWLVGGLFVVLFVVLVIGLKNEDYDSIIYTKENLKFSINTFLNNLFSKKSLVYGLVVGLFTWLVGGPGLFMGLAFGLFIGLVDFLANEYFNFIQINSPYQRFKSSAKRLHFSILQHWHLHYLLRKRNLLPKDLVGFLNAAAENHILDTDGATWRFRHKIIQDYFAELWEKEYKEKIKP